jgi:hypothetical protein
MRVGIFPFSMQNCIDFSPAALPAAKQLLCFFSPQQPFLHFLF